MTLGSSTRRCGHCQKLAPEWETAAKELKGQGRAEWTSFAVFLLPLPSPPPSHVWHILWRLFYILLTSSFSCVVKLGAVDATVHGSLAQTYGVKGYPTIKVFPGGKKGKAIDYNGPREADGITQYALKLAEDSGVPAKVDQIVDQASFDGLCGAKGKICVLLFVPHIYDSSATERNKLVEQLTGVAKGFRGKPLNFAWVEGNAQQVRHLPC